MGKAVFSAKKEEDDVVQLPILVKALTLKSGEPDYTKIKQRLESAYSNAVRDAMDQLKKEAAGYDRQIKDAMRAGNKAEAEKIRDSMPGYFDFDPQKQKVVLATGVEGGLRSMKDKFVERTMDVIKTCMFGKSVGEEEIVTSGSISFGRDAAMYATLLAPSLAKQLGMEKPENASETSKVAFTDARVTKGKFPLTIENQGDTISVTYASWISIASRTQVHDE